MNTEESVPEVGTWARDVTRDTVGCVMGHVGSHVQLRPRGGGQEWDAAPADLEPVPASELLRPRVAEANARSRKGSR
jgi:cobalamin biosynthesis Mg chelatase CobN